MRVLKILVAGGCHVDGWLVGKENSFVSVLSQKLLEENIPNEIVLKPYAILNKVNALIEVCQKENPDILILQYGNYEFSPSLITQIRKKLQAEKPVSGKSLSRPEPYNHTRAAVGGMDTTFKISPRYKVSQLVKDLANKLIFYSWLNKLKWNKVTDEAFQRIYALNIPKVVVLSPFPTSNIVTNKYRDQVTTILNTQANKYQFQFINVFAYLNKMFPRKILTLDEMHLNANSHQVVGSLICSEIAGDLKFSLKKKVNNPVINTCSK